MICQVRNKALVNMYIQSPKAGVPQDGINHFSSNGLFAQSWNDPLKLGQIGTVFILTLQSGKRITFNFSAVFKGTYRNFYNRIVPLQKDMGSSGYQKLLDLTHTSTGNKMGIVFHTHTATFYLFLLECKILPLKVTNTFLKCNSTRE